MALAACANPGERCRANATVELAKLNTMIADSEAAIARGYRESRSARAIETMDTCGSLYREGEPCLSQTDLVAIRPVAIDPAREEALLASLRQRLPMAREQAKTNLAQCPQ